MAEMLDQAGSRKRSTRVDLTPMVDLGFLLITFFVFTTTVAKPHAMRLFLPSDHFTPSPTTMAEGKTLTLLLGKDNTVYYYYGVDTTHLQKTDYSASGLRRIIQQKKQTVATKYGDAEKTFIFIKPTAGAIYQNLIAVLDEMTINDIKLYMLTDPSASELGQLQ